MGYTTSEVNPIEVAGDAGRYGPNFDIVRVGKNPPAERGSNSKAISKPVERRATAGTEGANGSVGTSS